MMTDQPSVAELEAFLEESLPAGRMASLEVTLRKDKGLQRRLADVVGRRDAGVHSLGEVWRRHRLSCPSREQLGTYLLGVLEADFADYIAFHLEKIGCRYCAANVADLRALQSAHLDQDSKHRQRRYFQSSAGYLDSKH